ncbi:DMT family transporter [Holospora curviuscula]|uniref:EamA-like transporter family protein n=1 Tax=Holospora curviuscula TaxID=1082868 RepID=A0A2S5R790_9PROT|nr:hypothetical protein [Holospora curviuscula]PPE03206.1 EamA-like transporter family protein [Holospora curviuscula]
MASIWAGVAHKVGSCLGFSCLNVAIKSAGLPVFWIVLIQNTGAFFWAYICFGYSLKLNIFSPLSCLRAFFALAGVVLWAASLQHLSLFQTISMGLFSPCATIVLAVLVLGESLTWNRAAAISISTLGGGLIQYGKDCSNLPWITPPQFSILPVLPFLATFCFAASNILAKKLLSRSSVEDVGCSLFVLTALGAGACIGVQHWYGLFLNGKIFFNHYTVHVQSILFWKDCIVLGSLTFLAHILMNRALSVHRVLFLLPFGISRPVVSAFLGWYFFKEAWPNPWMWTGSIAMIIAIILLSKKQ